VHAQLLAGVRVVVHLRRRRDGARVLDSIAVLTAEGAGATCADVAARMLDGGIDVGPGAAALDALLAGA